MIQGAVRLLIATMPEAERQELRERCASVPAENHLEKLKSDVFLRMCCEIWKENSCPIEAE